MTDKVYFIRHKDGTTRPVTTPTFPFDYHAIELFAHEIETGRWQVVEATTGCLVGNETDFGESREAVITRAKKIIEKIGIDSIKLKILRARQANEKPVLKTCNVMVG